MSTFRALLLAAVIGAALIIAGVAVQLGLGPALIAAGVALEVGVAVLLHDDGRTE